MVDIIRYSEIEVEEIYNEEALEMEDQDLKELEQNRERPYNYSIMRMIRDYNKIEECQKSVENTYEVAKNIYGFLLSNKDKMDEDTYKTLTHDVMIIMDDDDLACPVTGGSWDQFTKNMKAEGFEVSA